MLFIVTIHSIMRLKGWYGIVVVYFHSTVGYCVYVLFTCRVIVCFHTDKRSPCQAFLSSPVTTLTSLVARAAKQQQGTLRTTWRLPHAQQCESTSAFRPITQSKQMIGYFKPSVHLGLFTWRTCSLGIRMFLGKWDF